MQSDKGKMHALIVQKVMDVLEEMPVKERIVAAAYYCDGFDITYIAELLEISEIVVIKHRNSAMAYIQWECKCEVDANVIKESFQRLFRLRRYNVTKYYGLMLWEDSNETKSR